MRSIITYRSTKSSSKVLIKGGIMGSASSPSVLRLSVTHQEANSASSPLPLRMMRTGSAASFQLPATCKTTTSGKVAGRGERSTQGILPVCHLRRARAALGTAGSAEIGTGSLRGAARPAQPQNYPNSAVSPWLQQGWHCPRAAQPCPGRAPAPFGSAEFPLSWAARWPRPIRLLSGRNAIQKEVIKSRR